MLTDLFGDVQRRVRRLRFCFVEREMLERWTGGLLAENSRLRAERAALLDERVNLRRLLTENVGERTRLLCELAASRERCEAVLRMEEDSWRKFTACADQLRSLGLPVPGGVD